MKIIELKVKNFKALKLVDIDASGDIITLAGDNGAGKTSVLQALASALGGKEYQPAKPVHDGAARAEVAIALDDGHRLTLKVNPDGGRVLDVRGPNGVSIASPQRWLDARVGALSFNPLSFSSKKPREQAEELRRVIGLDLSKIDTEIAKAEADRLLVGRDRDKARGAAAVLPRYADAPAQPLDVAELHRQAGAIQAAAARKADLADRAADALRDAETEDASAAEYRRRLANGPATLEKRLAELDRRIAAEKVDLQDQAAAARKAGQDAIADCEAQIAALQRKIAATRQQIDTDAAAYLARIDAVSDRRDDDLAVIRQQIEARAAELTASAIDAEARADAKRKQAAELRADAAAVVSPDAAELRARIAAATEANAKAEANANAERADAEYQRLDTAYTAADAEIAGLRAERLAMIRACKMPVDGLSFDDEGLVTFAGRPLSDASHAQQVRVCTAIAVAGNPALRICLIDEANSLDRKSMAALVAEAQSHDLQVWMARIDGGPCAVVIEDGEVARPGAEL